MLRRRNELSISIALAAQLDQDVPRILMVNGLFIVLWIGSALLFRWEGDRLNRKG